VSRRQRSRLPRSRRDSHFWQILATWFEHILERHDGIISEADKGTSACKLWPHLAPEPFVQHVVQEDVREAR
jgi:hypothetical protein